MTIEVKNTKIGRPPGSPNKRNLEVFELAQELGITPMRVKFLLMCQEFEALGYTKDEIKELSVRDRIEIQDRNAADIAPYMYGKRKPVDSDGNDKGDPLAELADAIRNRT